MKSMKWLGLVVAVALPVLSGSVQAPATAAAPISPNASEVVKLAGSGVGEDVVLAFIQNSQSMFNLTADNVLYLRDLGVSQSVITAMLNHDNLLRSQAPQSAPQQFAPAPAAAPAPEAPAPAVAPVAQPPAQVAAPAPTYVSSPPPDVNYFYNDLAPYGSWVSVGGVGWCWQPSVVVVNRGWRPYCDGGHWVYTDAGWYWQSEYSWGWAPFHYGRWYMDAHCGWVWVPGRVWGPAWVTWRTAGTACGWAPLPPGADFAVGVGWRFNGVSVGASFDFGLGFNAFAFVSFGNFCAPNLAHHCLPSTQATVIYKQTTIVNNYTVVNNNYINHGIPVTRVAAASTVPVPRANLREGPAGGSKPIVRGGAVVYRTPLRAPERPANMVAQRVDAGHPTIQHNAYAPVGADKKPASGPGAASSTFQPNPNAAAKPSSGNSFSPTTGASTSKPPATGAGQTRQWQSMEKPAVSPNKGGADASSQKWQAPAKPGYGSQSVPANTTYQGQQLQHSSGSAYGSKPGTGTPNYGSSAAVRSQPYTSGDAAKNAGHAYGNAGQGQGLPISSPKASDQSYQGRSMYGAQKGSVPGTPNSSAGGQSTKPQKY